MTELLTATLTLEYTNDCGNITTLLYSTKTHSNNEFHILSTEIIISLTKSTGTHFADLTEAC